MEVFVRYSDRDYRTAVDRTLKARFSSLSLLYMNWSVKFLFYDYADLEVYLTGSGKAHHYNDYSFVVAPAYKAFEGVLYQMGVDLNLFSQEQVDSIINVGSFYEETQVQKALSMLLQGVLDLSQTVGKDKLKDITGRISETRNLLRRYRHSPAHYQGWLCIPTLMKAKGYGESIIFNVDDLIKLLGSVKLVQDRHLKGHIEYSNYP